MAKKRGEGPAKSDDWGEMQARMTRAIISELRNDLEDLLAGLEAGSLDYIVALKALKIQLLEVLDDPLVGAVEVKYQKVSIPLDAINVPPPLRKKKGSRRGRSEIVSTAGARIFLDEQPVGSHELCTNGAYRKECTSDQNGGQWRAAAKSTRFHGYVQATRNRCRTSTLRVEEDAT